MGTHILSALNVTNQFTTESMMSSKLDLVLISNQAKKLLKSSQAEKLLKSSQAEKSLRLSQVTKSLLLNPARMNLTTVDSKILIMTFPMIQIGRTLFNGKKEEEEKNQMKNQVSTNWVRLKSSPNLNTLKMSPFPNQWFSMTITICIPKST